MRSGVIGHVEGTSGKIEPFSDAREEGDIELRRQLELRSKLPGPRGNEAYSGRAAIERTTDREQVQFFGEEIIVNTQKEKIQLYTDFLLIPDSFMVVESGRGEFAFNLIEEQTNLTIERVEIDLYKLYDYCSQYQPEPWQVGFFGKEGRAKKGVVYGEGVLSDPDLGEILEASKKNQLGLEFEVDNGTKIKFTVTKSGYLDVYQPDNYDEIDFMNFIEEFIIPNLSK